MIGDIFHFPSQFLFDPHSFLSLFHLKPKSIFACGMGGSSLPLDMVNDCYGDQAYIHIIHGYELPINITNDDLVICCSYSGNTEETLSCFKQALEKKIPMVILTHGGKLKELALKNHLPLVEIPECLQPRCAVGYFFTALGAILEKVGFIPSQKNILNELKVFLEKRKSHHDVIGKKLSSFFLGKVPLIYAPTELKGIARIWKIKINENAKVQSFYNTFPELNHNEMVGFTKLLMNPIIVYLKSKFMHPRIGRRMDVMKEILGDKIPFLSINLEGENLLQEMFEAHAMADYSSYYLAKLYGIDPTPVHMVEDFKKRLG